MKHWQRDWIHGALWLGIGRRFVLSFTIGHEEDDDDLLVAALSIGPFYIGGRVTL